MKSTEIKEMELKHENKRLKTDLMNAQDQLQIMKTLNQEMFRAYRSFQIREKARQFRVLQRVETTLDIKLYDWVKSYVFAENTEGMMPDGRRWGKTTACILRLILSDGEPIHVRSPRDLAEYAESDSVTPDKLRFFWEETHRTYRILKEAGGIGLREIEWK